MEVVPSNKKSHAVKILPDGMEIDILAKEVNDGLWGKGAAVKRRLTQAGYDPFPILSKASKLKAAQRNEGSC